MLHHSLATGLEQDDFGATPVHDAAEQGQLECLHVFYNHSVDLNQQDSDGYTPMWAVIYKYFIFPHAFLLIILLILQYG